MKSAMPYLGIQTPELRAVCKQFFEAHPIQTAGDWRSTCLRIWREAEFREERYAAIGLTGFRLYRSFQTLNTVAMYEEMIVTGAWWDYVDSIASKRAGCAAELLSWPNAQHDTKVEPLAESVEAACRDPVPTPSATPTSICCTRASRRRFRRRNSFCKKPSAGHSGNMHGPIRARSPAMCASMGAS